MSDHEKLEGPPNSQWLYETFGNASKVRVITRRLRMIGYRNKARMVYGETAYLERARNIWPYLMRSCHINIQQGQPTTGVNVLTK